MTTRDDDAGRRKVFELIKDVQVAMFTTRAEDGVMHARPMVGKRDERAGELWFFTGEDALKVDEIERDPRVQLSYAEPDDQNYVSISGRAEVWREPGKIKELWSEPLRTWFPNGPDDPNITLIRVKLERASYWDSPSSTMVYAYGYLKARLTGEPPQPGEVDEVDFRR
jgi:general stress protein 26